MKVIKRKIMGKIDYAKIDDNNYYEILTEKYKDSINFNYEWLYQEINDIKYIFPLGSDNLIIGDFIFDIFMPFCVVSEKVYRYLFIDNPEMSDYLMTKTINLINNDILHRKSNDDELGQYYIIIPKKVFNENEKDKINGIAWSVEKKSYIADDETFYHFDLCLSDNFIKDFKTQKFTGIELNKDEKIEVRDPDNIYYESNETNVKKKIANFLQEVSKKKILKSKCKYIYYTIIEEENSYTLGVAGYMNKYFDDETFSFDPNMCELINTDLGKIEWEECMVKLQEIIQEIYSLNDNDFYKIKAFIGYHDSDIYNIN